MEKFSHKHYELARRAHYNTSFTPEIRAQSYCMGFDADIQKLRDLCVPEEKISKYERLWVKWMQAKSRCLSSMITGSANFPVARNEKANRAERRASDESAAYYDKLIKYAEKDAFYKENPEARPIMAGDADALERLKQKLADHVATQEKMKAANALIRKGDLLGLAELLGERQAEKILEPAYGRAGFAPYALDNNRAEITRLKERIKDIEGRKATQPKDIMINGVRVFENTDDMRLQLFFDGKPPQEIIALLKKNAFKWSPKNSAWQRQLTNNAVYSFTNFVAPEIKKMGQSNGL